MRTFFVLKAEQPRESSLYHPYAFRFAWSERNPERPAPEGERPPRHERYTYPRHRGDRDPTD